MKEYFGKSAKTYIQTIGKKFLLIPAVSKYLKGNKKGLKILDVGCGNGDFFSIAKKHGYKYYGLDISEEMLSRARADFPQGKYLLSSALSFASKYDFKFEVILISMLFPALGALDKIRKVLKEAKFAVKKDGKIIIGVTHPAFDHYMQKELFKRKDVRTNFQGYFKSGIKFLTPQKMGSETIIFEDYHWTINDYVSCIRREGLKIELIDECQPDVQLKKVSKSLFAKRDTFPTYMLMICKKS